MQLSDFDYHLPQKLIAQTPADPRDSARLLCLEKSSGSIQDAIFSDITDKLTENDVLVVNQTRVIKARLKGKIIPTDTSLNPSLEKRERAAASSLLTKERVERGQDCEIFLHKQISENSWDCLVYPGKKLKPGKKVLFEDSKLQAEIKEISEKGRVVEFSLSGKDFLDAIEQIGETPLPPYIKNSESEDERYQTVYNTNEKSGSVAAPTAGLHFTPELMQKLEDKGVIIEKVTLNVGLGTFANVEVDNITDHHMHSERIEIDEETAKRLNNYRSQGKNIVAVGTTSVRTLESFSDENGILGHGMTDTQIFIYPGYQWKFVDKLITNFHLPKSTLVMLVSSFAGDDNRKRAYRHAIDSQYRFFSFGDAMFIY